MNDKVQLPSNFRFGIFFTFIFLIISIYFLYNNNFNFFLLFVLMATFFFILSIMKPILLLPLNKLWMQLGFILGFIVRPLVLGFIFFIILSPIALILKFFNRDELNLKMSNKFTYWKEKEKLSSNKEDFKNQY